MKNKTKVFTFLLAMVVFLSSTGRVFSLHFCKMEESGCKKETSCCCEKSVEVQDCFTNELPDNCCLNSLNYIINPFSVRLPENQISKINIVALDVRLYLHLFNADEYAVNVKHLFYDDVAPPSSADLLTMISTFQI